MTVPTRVTRVVVRSPEAVSVTASDEPALRLALETTHKRLGRLCGGAHTLTVAHRTDAMFASGYDACHALSQRSHTDWNSVISEDNQRAPIILVTDDVEETRDGIERLLRGDGYCVDSARDEEDAVARACRQRPDLILVSLGGPHANAVASAQRIRLRAELGDEVPVVIFCVPTVDEGAEVALGKNVYVTRPDNFDQLRGFLGRLLYGLF